MKQIIIYFISLFIYIIIGAENGFSDWIEVGNIPGAGSEWNISVVDSNIVWVAGGDSGHPSIWRSTNEGINFIQMPSSGISLDLYCVWGINSTTCYVGDGGAPMGAGGNAKVYLTTNSGVVWNTVLSTGGSSGFINGIVFSRLNPQIGVVESDPPDTTNRYWWKLTTNGGITWAQINSPSIPNLASAENTVVCIDNLFFGVGSSAVSGNTGKWIFTTNGGANFNVVQLPLTGAQPYVSTISFNTNKLNGVAALSYSLPNIARTTDGGFNWSVSNVGAGVTGRCTAKWVPGTNTAYLIGQTGNLLGRKSTDGGYTWIPISTGNVSNFNHMDLVKQGNNIYGFAVTENGIVCRLVEPVIGIINYGYYIPENYKLEQNYPNPFNPLTIINYELKIKSYIKIVVYDVTGKEVIIPINQKQSKGYYKITFDGSGFASGVYFYSLFVDGVLNDSKKMILVK